MLKFIYILIWWITSKLSGHICPFTGIVCIDSSKTFQQIFDEMKNVYRLGVRIIRFDGEALAWENDGKNFENIIDAAKKIGFANLGIFWDGQKDLNTSADTIFIQMNDIHNSAEEDWNSFVANIAQIENKPIYAIYTLSKNNYNELENVLKFVVGNPKIKEIGFAFDNDSFQDEQKYFVIDKILESKKKGFQITNSYRSLVAEKNSKKNYKYHTRVFGYDGDFYDIETFSLLMPVIEEQKNIKKVNK